MANSCKLIDSHCHIPMLENLSLEEVLRAADENDVGEMLCVSVDLDSLPDVIATAEASDRVYASVGLHPNSQIGTEPDVATLMRLAGHEKVIAIGETGLDYYRSEGDLDWQRERFRTHIQAARESGKPLIIHSREAREDVIRILREEGADSIGGVMHCFVDDWATACSAMDLDFYISFSGIVTFKNATDLQQVARQVPLDRILVETDSPYLAPVPFRGKQNQPAYVRYVAESIAELKGISYEQIADATTDNFYNAFRLAV